MRVANIDMRNNSHTCPSGLSLISSPKRLCDITNYRTCVSNSFSVQDITCVARSSAIRGVLCLPSTMVPEVSMGPILAAKVNTTTSGLLLVQGMRAVISLGGSVPV